jgi:3D-(3,5/4)-trihydroxycyclohexane-1,2-dione acylhydrolase (decyclizing)
MGIPFTVILTDNRGYGCINRLQKHTGGAPFNNLLDDAYHVNPSAIDFVAHAASMGARAAKAGSIADLETKITAMRAGNIPSVIVIDTDPMPSTAAGGTWWEVGVPEVSIRPAVNEARQKYETSKEKQRLAD